jgi:hypothetical protein
LEKTYYFINIYFFRFTSGSKTDDESIASIMNLGEEFQDYLDNVRNLEVCEIAKFIEKSDVSITIKYKIKNIINGSTHPAHLLITIR